MQHNNIEVGDYRKLYGVRNTQRAFCSWSCFRNCFQNKEFFDCFHILQDLSKYCQVFVTFLMFHSKVCAVVG